MSRRLSCRSFIFSLMIAVTLPAVTTGAFASMLDPDSDTTIDNIGPSSSMTLKEKLDAARQAAGSAIAVPEKTVTTSVEKTPNAIIHKEVTHVGVIDDTANNENPPVFPTVAASAPIPPALQPAQINAGKPVDQQIVRLDSGTLSPVGGDMHNLLFDDVIEKPVATNNIASSYKAMPAAPVVPVQNEYISAPAPTPVPQAKITFPDAPIHQQQVTTSAPVAMPPPPMMAMPEAMPMAPAPVYAAPVITKPRPQAPPVTPYVPAVEIRKAPAPVASSRFKPVPAKAIGDWSLRDLKATSPDKKDAVCLLQNRFDNNLTLVIGQSAEGDILLALDYGIEMLSTERSYKPKVEIDESFNRDYAAYANGTQKLMIQIGKDPQFFAALQSGNALHIGLPGTASTFALDNMNQGLQNFAKCVADIGGPALPSALQQRPMMAAGQVSMPPVPVEPVMQENITPSAPVYAAAPVAIPAQQNYQQPQPGYWPDATLGLLKQSGIVPYQLQSTDTAVQWLNANGALHSSAQRIPVADILDASSLLLDRSQKTCGGQFASQMGVPEKRGSNDVLQMESKCNRGGRIMVSTWLIAKDARGVTAWQMEASRDDRGLAFDARQQLLNTLAR